MASQPLMAFALIGLGVRQLSVAPRSVPLVKRIVRGISRRGRRRGGERGAGRGDGAPRRRRRSTPLAGVLGDEALFWATDCPRR